MTETYIVISDLQCPLHDKKAVANVIEFIRRVRPAGLLCVGDDADLTEPARWSKGYAAEYAPTLQRSLDATHNLLAEFRSALGPNKPFHLSRSNHNDRLEKYVNAYAPALRTLRGLNIEGLLDYEGLGIAYHRKPYEFAPGWMLAHGDEGSMSRIPGATAKNLAIRWGKSVICGHTHSLGMCADSVGVNGRLKTVYGIEVGHLMDIRKASYLKAHSANWQQGIGIVHVNDRKVTAYPVPLIGGKVPEGLL